MSKLSVLLESLESAPKILGRIARDLSKEEACRRGKSGGSSFVENIWHMADLEREGYGERIQRLKAEQHPSLPDFEGERLAAERQYQNRNLAEGVALFDRARSDNLGTLRTLSEAEWKRAGSQAKVGEVTLQDLPRMMAEHDQSHARDIRQLLSEVVPARPTLPELGQLAERDDPALDPSQ